MSQGKVFITRDVPSRVIETLKEDFHVEVNPHDRELTKEELAEAVKEKDALLCLLTDTIDAQVLDAADRLKIVANYAVGFNNIDIDAAVKRGIAVANTPGVLTETSADFAWTLLMAAARRLGEAERFLRAGKFKGWKPLLLLGDDVYGRVLGIVGMGRIGKAVAERARCFKMKVIYYDERQLTSEEENQLNAEFYPFEKLIRESDFISLHVPLTESTKYMIGKKELEEMKETAYLINTARGPVIDEKALIEALKNKVIAGAALDVFEYEPYVPEELMELENAVLAPHVASATKETRERMGMIAAENIIAALKGEQIPNLVNKEILEA